jgi:hypothetical protein
VGAIGFLSLIWLYARAVRTLGRRAKQDASSYGWLLACLATAIAAFPVGMVTYDAFSFTQVTFVSFILVGLGSVALRLGPEPDEVAAAAAAEAEAARELDDRRGRTADVGFARA